MNATFSESVIDRVGVRTPNLVFRAKPSDVHSNLSKVKKGLGFESVTDPIQKDQKHSFNMYYSG